MKASLIIRTFNEEKFLDKLLSSVFKQKTTYEFEVVIVDSGSTDSTLNIASKYQTRIVKISPDDFTFGYSLNVGIKNATGDICVITSAHCYPTDEHWLHEIVTPFHDSKIALVYGRQIGGETTAYSEHRIFQRWYPTHDIDDGDLAFCNNANSAIRKKVWEDYKFDEELTGLEDLDWAKHVKKLGHSISYKSRACVHHIHNENYKQVFNRYYREALAYKQIYKNEHFSFFDFIKFFTMNTFGDWISAVHEKKFLSQFFSIFMFRLCQFWGTYKAHNYRVPIHKPMKKRLYYPDSPFNRNQKNVTERIKKGQIFDISRTVSNEIDVWPGANKFQHKIEKSHEQNGFMDSDIALNVHTATHIDAPAHHFKDGKFISEIDLEVCTGKCLVIDCDKEEIIDKKFLKKFNNLKNHSRVLFKTQNSFIPQTTFNKDYIGISEDAADYLCKINVRLVGIDGPSVQPFIGEEKVHHILLGKNVVILENVILNQVKAGEYKLTALPIKLHKVEGAPVRAILKGE